jgi:hypothetical protein
MEYWRGTMNWPIDPGWSCETCGDTSHRMTWGFVHGQCRCDRCHTVYSMGTGKDPRTIPLCMLKDEYKAPARAGWEEYRTPYSEWTDAMWDHAFLLAGVPVPA